jgi:hypothetical protein
MDAQFHAQLAALLASGTSMTAKEAVAKAHEFILEVEAFHKAKAEKEQHEKSK